MNIVRVKTVYDNFYWVNSEDISNPNKVLIPVYVKRLNSFIKRIDTKAGQKDYQNMLHKENITHIIGQNQQ